MVNFPTRQENTLDLVFTSHLDYKIRCKPLPPIGEKSDHDIVLFETSHQVYRGRPRKIFLWAKKNNVEGIRRSIKVSRTTCIYSEFYSIVSMWAVLKRWSKQHGNKMSQQRYPTHAILILVFLLALKEWWGESKEHTGKQKSLVNQRMGKF